MNAALPINTTRLQAEIDELAAISEAPAPAVTRVLFSERDLEARAWVKAKCRRSRSGYSRGCGRQHLRALGRHASPICPAIATGSHIDAIPNAGSYDGVVGVLGALEAFRALQGRGLHAPALHRVHRLHRRGTDAFRPRLPGQPFAVRARSPPKPPPRLRDADKISCRMAANAWLGQGRPRLGPAQRPELTAPSSNCTSSRARFWS